MDYIFVTLDAIHTFVSCRYLQSGEFPDGSILAEILKGKGCDWDKYGIKFYNTQTGGVFYTNSINRNKGILFDYSSFDGFINNSTSGIITIFQKILRYAIRYFECAPLAPNEKALPEKNTIIVYPFPFVPAKDVYKVFVDKNSTKWGRKDKDFLIVYASGRIIDDDKFKVSSTNINKVVPEISNIIIDKSTIHASSDNQALCVTELDGADFSLDGMMQYQDWLMFLTKSQRDFVEAPINGSERLEGAAGTGKTLSMILRCINLLKLKIEQELEFHIIFVTHSVATKKHIIDIFNTMFPGSEKLITTNINDSIVNINITTLQEWCISFLGTDIAETEYIDKDAQDSKGYQKMVIEQAWSEAYRDSYPTYKKLCSLEFIDFIENTSSESLIEMLQHEIAIIIKGRAESDIDRYKQLKRPKYSIPCKNEGDYAFLFVIFLKYQKFLEKSGQYDSDDIILTTLGRLETPIWKRRRNLDGYNVCFIDETQMFNLNELSVFHYLNKDEFRRNIIFAIDKSQAIGDRDLTDDNLSDSLNISKDLNIQQLGTVFRSSPDIVNLAFNVLSSGATLFTNFENPLEKSIFNFTLSEEKKCGMPIYIGIDGDERMIEEAFVKADVLCKSGMKKSKILITVTDEFLMQKTIKYASENNKTVEILKSRGDSYAVQTASKHNLFVISGIDYVGGLEFDAEIIIGVDKGRVPPNTENTNQDSYHFLNYAWHNRMYVAITRAKYIVIILGDKGRGVSEILSNAISYKAIKTENWN